MEGSHIFDKATAITNYSRAPPRPLYQEHLQIPDRQAEKINTERLGLDITASQSDTNNTEWDVH